jgi:hypothetical protein
LNPVNPSPPYFDGRITDAFNVVDQLEFRLESSKTDFFQQPLTTDLVAFANDLFVGSVEGITGRVQVPGFVSVGGSIGGSGTSVEIEFMDAGVKCKYKPNDDDDEFVFKSCSKQFTAGDFVAENNGGEITIGLKHTQGFEGSFISVELYHYDAN